MGPGLLASHALWHCLRGISYMPLALSTRRPRSASGSRPSRFSCSLALSARHLVHALGTVYEAPTFSQWVPAFSLSRLALARLSKSAPQTCPQRDQRLCAAHAHKRCSVALMPPTKSTGWAFPHTTLVLRQVFPRTPFKMSFLGFKRQQST